MASLARSLLALALVALLQTASGKFRGLFPGYKKLRDPRLAKRQECTSVLMGRRALNPEMTYELDPIRITEANSNVKINDPRENVLGVQVIGQDVTVCNLFDRNAPEVSRTSPSSFDYVDVALGFCVPPPILMEMRVTRYIEPIIPDIHSDSDESFYL